MSAVRVERVVKSFGGVHAVRDVSFDVPRGTLTALIGPNGAGKTTLFNVLTNVYPPNSGAIHLLDQPVTGLPSWHIGRMGVVRTFQTARVFPGMTVLENLQVGAHQHLRGGMWQQMATTRLTRREEQSVRDRAEYLLRLVGLGAFRDMAAMSLPMGAQKMLEMARALMAAPKLLLLDEPAAGLNDTETDELALLLRSVRNCGITVMVVEHNMSLVMKAADEIIVLDAGQLVARGTPEAIRGDPRVIEAYVGRIEAEAGHA